MISALRTPLYAPNRLSALIIPPLMSVRVQVLLSHTSGPTRAVRLTTRLPASTLRYLPPGPRQQSRKLGCDKAYLLSSFFASALAD